MYIVLFLGWNHSEPPGGKLKIFDYIGHNSRCDSWMWTTVPQKLFGVNSIIYATTLL